MRRSLKSTSREVAEAIDSTLWANGDGQCVIPRVNGGDRLVEVFAEFDGVVSGVDREHDGVCETDGLQAEVLCDGHLYAKG